MTDEMAERGQVGEGAGTELRATRFTLVDGGGRARAAARPSGADTAPTRHPQNASG